MGLGSLGVFVVIAIIAILVVSLLVTLCWMQTYKNEKKVLLLSFQGIFSQMTIDQLKKTVIPHVYEDVTGLHYDLARMRSKLINKKPKEEIKDK